jgi:hypothetical protein
MKKYTYIKYDVEGYYIEFDEKFDETLYNNIGKIFEDFLENRWLLLSDEQVAFHIEHPEASVEEVWNMQLKQRTLDQAKEEMIEKITEYDSSTEVNSFTINNEIEGWFTPEERSNYKSSIDAAKLVGLNELSFFIGDMLLTVSPTQAEYMLAQIQLYADQCYIVTKEHKIEVMNLESIEDVDSYDYTKDYPEKINFTYPFDFA